MERSIRLQNASTTTAFYLQDEWRRWYPRLLVLPGVRLDYSTFTREWVLSPRLGLRYALTDGLLGRAGWGFYHQAPDFVGLFERFEREIEWNLFETIVLKTERAQHFTAGVEWDRGRAHGARLEGYYKRLDHLVAARDSTWQSIPDNSGRGHAYGLELFLQRRPSAVTPPVGLDQLLPGGQQGGQPPGAPALPRRRPGATPSTWWAAWGSPGGRGSTCATATAAASPGPRLPAARKESRSSTTRAALSGSPSTRGATRAYRRLDVRLSWRRGFGGGRTLTAYLEAIKRPQPQECLRVLLGRRLPASGQLHAADDALLRAAPGLLIAGGDLDRVRPYSRSLERNRHQASSRKMTVTSRA